MFENLPDQSGVRYTVSLLERAMADEERLRLRLIREGQRFVAEAEKAVDGRLYREISEYNPNPIREYNAAVAKVNTMIELLRAVDWATMVEGDRAEHKNATFQTWISDLWAAARAE